jgi:hypothetical protein
MSETRDYDFEKFILSILVTGILGGVAVVAAGGGFESKSGHSYKLSDAQTARINTDARHGYLGLGGLHQAAAGPQGNNPIRGHSLAADEARLLVTDTNSYSVIPSQSNSELTSTYRSGNLAYNSHQTATFENDDQSLLSSEPVTSARIRAFLSDPDTHIIKLTDSNTDYDGSDDSYKIETSFDGNSVDQEYTNAKPPKHVSGVVANLEAILG